MKALSLVLLLILICQAYIFAADGRAKYSSLNSEDSLLVLDN